MAKENLRMLCEAERKCHRIIQRIHQYPMPLTRNLAESLEEAHQRLITISVSRCNLLDEVFPRKLEHFDLSVLQQMQL